MKSLNDMNPTELLRYQVELLKEVQNLLATLNENTVKNRVITVADFDVSFSKLFGIVIKLLCVPVVAFFVIALIAELTTIF